MDIQHDRAGYYICWGCLVWLPIVYTSQTYYLVEHPHNLGAIGTALNLAAGTAFPHSPPNSLHDPHLITGSVMSH